jgi:hypothetical protein
MNTLRIVVKAENSVELPNLEDPAGTWQNLARTL